MKTYFSYSEMRAWNYDKDKYIKTYIQGEQDEGSLEQRLGVIIHKALENPKYDWLKELRLMKYPTRKIAKVRLCLTKMTGKTPPGPEPILTCELRSGVKLLAKYDGIDKAARKMVENKTTDDDDRWNNWIVDLNDQISLYSLVWWMNMHSYFKEIILYRLNIAKGTVQPYPTSRSRRDHLYIEAKINKAVSEIKAAGLWEKRLSLDERNQKTIQMPL